MSQPFLIEMANFSILYFFVDRNILIIFFHNFWTIFHNFRNFRNFHNFHNFHNFWNKKMNFRWTIKIFTKLLSKFFVSKSWLPGPRPRSRPGIFWKILRNTTGIWNWAPWRAFFASFVIFKGVIIRVVLDKGTTNDYF